MNENATVPHKTAKMSMIMEALLGTAAVIIPIVVAIMVWPALANGHPAYPILLGLLFAVGVLLLIFCKKPKKSGKLRMAGRIAGAVLLTLILAITMYLRPFPSNERGIKASQSTGSIEVIHRWDAWELIPRNEAATVGFVFLPGMLVEPRAYFPLLTPLVEQGVYVIVPTAPMGISANGAYASAKAMRAMPEIDTWIIGGHSMGGAAASSVADNNPNIDGLVIWASFSGFDMSDSDVPTILIYGTNDPYADSAAIDSNRQYLPTDTVYVAVEGGVHAHFADYDQYGDGEPGVDWKTAAGQIIEETLLFIESLKKK